MEYINLIEFSREKDYNGSRWVYYCFKNQKQSLEFLEKKDVVKNLISKIRENERNVKEITLRTYSIKTENINEEKIPEEEISQYQNSLANEFPNIEFKKAEPNVWENKK